MKAFCGMRQHPRYAVSSAATIGPGTGRRRGGLPTLCGFSPVSAGRYTIVRFIQLRRAALLAALAGATLPGPAHLSAQSAPPLPFPDSIVLAARTPTPPKADTKKEERWKASAELGLTDQSGSRDLRLFTGGFKASHLKKEAFRLDLSVQSRYGKSEGEVVSRNHYATLAFDLHPERDWSPFVTFEAEHDPFKRLAVRSAGGVGAKYVAFRAPGGNDISISGALLASYRRLTRMEEGDTEPRDQALGRWSLRVKGGTQLPAGATLSHTTFFQPSWDQMGDYLLRSESGLRARITSNLALSVIYEFDRTSLPPAGVSPENRILKTGFIIEF